MEILALKRRTTTTKLNLPWTLYISHTDEMSGRDFETFFHHSSRQKQTHLLYHLYPMRSEKKREQYLTGGIR